MGKVTFNMSMSLDGFVAGPNDNPDNGMGDGGMRLFDWYSSGSTEIPMEDGNMVLKVSPVSAEILQRGHGHPTARGYGAARPSISPGPGAAIRREPPPLSSPTASRKNGSTRVRRLSSSPMGSRAPSARQSRPPATRMW